MDFNINEEQDPDEEVNKFNAADTPNMEDCVRNRADLLERIRSNIEKARQMQKEQYNKKHTVAGAFALGNLLLKRDFMRRKRHGGKIET